MQNLARFRTTIDLIASISGADRDVHDRKTALSTATRPTACIGGWVQLSSVVCGCSGVDSGWGPQRQPAVDQSECSDVRWLRRRWGELAWWLVRRSRLRQRSGHSCRRTGLHCTTATQTHTNTPFTRRVVARGINSRHPLNFNLSENFLPTVQNLRLQISVFSGEFKAGNWNFFSTR